ncbi:MAG: DUF4386 domain-containing protein [Pseudomonadota bacterium]
MSQSIKPIHTARQMARIAGLSYLIYTLAGLYITFGPTPGLGTLKDLDVAAADHELLFRLDFLAEAILYTAVGLSSAAMYAVLRTVSLGMAIMGAFCRLVEASMGATFIVLKFAAFTAATNPNVLVALSNVERGAVTGFLAHVYGSAIYFLLIPMAIGGVLFFSLFFRARFIPRWLSIWGMLTYTIIGCLAATVLVDPDLREHVMLFFLPGALFEWIVALWLLFGGINTQHWENVGNG